MNLWPCFACESTRACEHREWDLVAWYAKLTREERPAAHVLVHPTETDPSIETIGRKPPARETQQQPGRARRAGGSE